MASLFYFSFGMPEKRSVVSRLPRKASTSVGLVHSFGMPIASRMMRITVSVRVTMWSSILAPILTGVIFGVAGILGLLVGGQGCGFVLAIFMANSGCAWDNAKKYIEEGNFGGKGSDSHKATVFGDTVGNPFKDTSGPSLNILIKLMSMVSIVFPHRDTPLQ